MSEERWLSRPGTFQARTMTAWYREVAALERRAKRSGSGRRGRFPATLLVVGDTCWSCRASVRAIVGVLVDPGLTGDRSGFVPLADVDRILMAVVDAGTLSGREIGALRHRPSPGVQGGYVSNGCPQCDALIGRFRVDDLLSEHRRAGGTLADLAIDVTVDLLADRVWRGAPRMR
jgi:hypothetical protein